MSKVSDKRKAYERTPKGKARRMWYSICDRVNNKRGDLPSYVNINLEMTRQQFLDWSIPQLILWTEPLCGSRYSPSVDRFDNTKGYNLNNIRLISRAENTLRRERNKNVYAPTGKAWCNKCKQYINKIHFQKDRGNYSGVANACKFCVNQRYKFFNKLENNT